MEFDPAKEGQNTYRPLILSPISPADSKIIAALKNHGSIVVSDTIENQVGELIKINHPTEVFSPEVLQDRVTAYFEGTDKETFGVWVYYPWRDTLVRVLEEKDFIRVRTSRNRFKIRDEEQEILQDKKIGIIGLSVGQSVALSLAMERAFGELRIADFDTLELSNMNRIRTGLYNLGIKKTWMVAREIAEIDPFLKLTVYDDGITEENMHDFLTFGGKLDILIDECDSLAIKISSRLKAKSMGIPVLMDTSDRGMMDVERFDLEPTRPIFHGLLSDFGRENDLLEMLKENAQDILMKILDVEKLSIRAKESLSQIGKTITTWPQLASTVFMGGGACGHIARLILLDNNVNSARYFVDLDEIIELNGGQGKDSKRGF